MNVERRPTLRSVTPEDDAFLRTVYASSRAEEMAIVPWPDEFKSAFLADQYDAQRTHYEAHYPEARNEIVMLDEEPVGRMWTEVQAKEIRLMEFILLPAARDSGVGSALLRNLQRKAQGLGLAITLHVIHGNDAAKRFYESHGFADVEDIGSHVLMAWSPTDG